MIELDGGVVLPLPPRKNPKGFTKPEDITAYRWKKDKVGRWQRAYMHCLYSLPLHFDLPLHSVVPRLARKMKEASNPFNVAMRFMGEMEIAGYIKFERGMDERVVVPTKKFLNLDLDCDRAPESVITYPLKSGSYLPKAPVRGGIKSVSNDEALKITKTMMNEEFEINPFTLELAIKYPPEFEKLSDSYMYERTIESAKKFLGTQFKFPMFSDSRGRVYVSTTCGFNPQGADHEKGILLPTHKEVLTNEGFKALVETAHGYSEIEWSVEEMCNHANDPEGTRSVWKDADKPICYMAIANLINTYMADSSSPIPGFIPLDGRCSGLQHWTALTRSNAISSHLGMVLDEAKLDIYEKIAEDWKEVLPDEWKFLATRKAAKIPVMTWGYNATIMTSIEWIDRLFGAKKAWDNNLKKYVIVGKGLDRKTAAQKGADLYKRLNESLGPLREAVDWVSDCAVEIAKFGNTEITWPTPDGFMAMQRKVKGKRLQLTCNLSTGAEMYLEVLDFTQEIPNTAKHRSAIAPNIIHSLDATHLRMVARRLEELGLPMIFIHDSFATHCNHRDTLYSIIVEEFVKLYTSEYLMTLFDYWTATYGVKLTLPPEQGDWEPSSLMNLERFFL